MANTLKPFAWQIPISDDGRNLAHYFLESKDTTHMVSTMCGLQVNPGYAIPGVFSLRCENCIDRLGEDNG